jgi:hypothetical protein
MATKRKFCEEHESSFYGAILGLLASGRIDKAQRDLDGRIAAILRDSCGDTGGPAVNESGWTHLGIAAGILVPIACSGGIRAARYASPAARSKEGRRTSGQTADIKAYHSGKSSLRERRDRIGGARTRGHELGCGRYVQAKICSKQAVNIQHVGERCHIRFAVDS